MIHVTQGYQLGDRRAAKMFAERKAVFVDLLGWDLNVADDCYEIDEFDGDEAIYLIADDGHEHLGSLRLLPTTAPHVLGDLFPQLCDHDVPRGSSIYEITRLCLPARLGAAGRLRARNRLISAMVDYSLQSQISVLTGVVKADFLAQILRMGWRCAPLGQPQRINGVQLSAFRIEVDLDTPRRLADGRIYEACTAAQVHAAEG